MDKKKKSHSKEKEKEKKMAKKQSGTQIVVQKDIIYCKNTIQNNNPNINININIKNNNKTKSSNRVLSAHYTINSKHYKQINKSLGKKRPYELKKIYLNTINNATNSNSKKKSLRNYLTKNHSNSKQRININSNKNKLNKINIKVKHLSKDNKVNKKAFNNNMLIEKIVENKFGAKGSLFEEDLEIMGEYEELKSLWRDLGITNNFVQNFEYMNNNKTINREEVLQIIKAEKKQMIQFKNELLRVLKEIEKREDEIKNIKNLEKKIF